MQLYFDNQPERAQCLSRTLVAAVKKSKDEMNYEIRLDTENKNHSMSYLYQSNTMFVCMCVFVFVCVYPILALSWSMDSFYQKTRLKVLELAKLTIHAYGFSTVT